MEPVLFSYEARLIRVGQKADVVNAHAVSFSLSFDSNFEFFFSTRQFLSRKATATLQFRNNHTPATTRLLPDSFTSAILDQNENELHSHRVYSSILGGFRIVRSLYGASLPDRETCDEWNCNMQPEQRCDGIGFVSLATRSSDVPGATAAPQSAAQM